MNLHKDVVFANYLPLRKHELLFLRILIFMRPRENENEPILFDLNEAQMILSTKYNANALIKNLLKLGYITEIKKDTYVLNEEFYSEQVQKTKAELMNDNLTENETRKLKTAIYKKLGLFSVYSSETSDLEKARREEYGDAYTETRIDECIKEAQKFIRTYDKNKIISFKTKSGIEHQAEIVNILYDILFSNDVYDREKKR